MPRTISPADLASCSHMTVIDVRKDPARRASGMKIPGSLRRRPSEVELWWRDFAGQPVVVFCVHGHEVSREVAAYLCDHGIDAAVLVGGFEAWLADGHQVMSTGAPE